MKTTLDLTYSRPQQEIFFTDLAKFNIIPKGKRLGLTRGAAQAVIQKALQGITPILWGDTVNANIDRYFEGYFLPVLKQLDKSMYKWNQQRKQLKILDSVIDFRSADIPENWEGFGYRFIILNEAGIILKNDYLYDNVVLPMLIDDPDSVMIASGVPKGKLTKKGLPHKFHMLYETALNDTSGKYKALQYSTYDNPFLERSAVELLEEEIPDPAVVRQEIYGEFIDHAIKPWAYCFEEEEHVANVEYIEGLPVYLSFDFNVDPAVCLIWQEGRNQGEEWIHYIDEVYQNDSNVYNVCAEISVKYLNAHFMVTGDRTSKKREYTQKNNRTNAFIIIQKELGLKEAQFNLPRNPGHSFARTLCNSILARHKGMKIDPKCKELIKDLKYCETDKDDGIAKPSGTMRTHMLDAWVYSLNTFHHTFVRDID